MLTAQIHISCYTIFTTILVGRNNLNSYYCTMQVDSHAATCCWRTPRVCLNLPTHTPSWSAVVSHNRLQAKWSGSLRIIKQVLRQKAASYAIIPGNFKGDLQSPGQWIFHAKTCPLGLRFYTPCCLHYFLQKEKKPSLFCREAIIMASIYCSKL